ncbi:MAG: MBL fold metallo-hydrolase [Candidatus Thorarchaeota archaeon]|jgi:glyoxylase-like metal-dependent hydrolase (beta-lactamase superfamily II)
MPELERVTPHTVADTSIQRATRSCIIGGISLGNSVVAIDSGSSQDVGWTLRQDLESFFKFPVEYLFLTHTHTDHRHGMNAFNDVTLVVSRNCLENMPTNVRLRKWSVKPFEKKLVLVGDDLSAEFYLMAGHSVGSSIAYIPDEKVVFGGDLFIVGSVNFGLPCMHFYQNRPKKTGNPDEHIAAYEKIRRMGVEIIVPGHGDIVSSAQDYLKGQLTFFKDLRSFIISAINEGKMLEEIELPRLAPIEQAYTEAESRPKRSQALRWLNHYLSLLKLSFYNHYFSILTS